MEIDSNLIHLKLKNIYEEAVQNSKNSSLYGGKAGICMFGLLYCKHFKNGEIDPKLEIIIQDIIDGYLTLDSNTLSNGKAGINWFYFQMYKWDLIDLQDFDDISFEDINLSKIAISTLSKGNYDFLHGSLGIAYYLLKKKIDKGFFVDYFGELNRLSSRRSDRMIPNFDFMNNVVEEDRVNIGLAHGIVSILKFCLECYDNKICTNESYNLAQEIIIYLINNQNADKKVSYFSSLIIDNVEKNEASRLAWCYGDLCIAFILYQSALKFENNDLEKFSLEIFDHSMKRISHESTYISDAGLCHGTAGIAHIYNKMWQYTKHESFKNACEFWIDQTLRYDKFEDTTSGYKKYFAPSGKYESSTALLEGSTGIGLVLLSYLTNDFDWDYCIMLN